METIKSADAAAIQIKGPQREEKGDNKQSGCRDCCKSKARSGRKRTTLQSADAEAMQN